MWNVAQRHIVPRSSTLARHLATTAGAHKNVKAPLALSIGASSGTLSALTGVGGGILIIPVLRMATQLTQQQCNGTSLFAVTLSSTAGALSYTLSGLPNFPLAAVFVCTDSGAPCLLLAACALENKKGQRICARKFA